jgi:uncharacterized RDD family membrane protein YckC
MNIENQLEKNDMHLSTTTSRAFAYSIDEIIISVLFAVIFWDKLTSFDSPQSTMEFSRSIFPYIMLVKVLYQSIFVWMYGATLGKMAVKIRVVEIETMQNPTFMSSFLRANGRIISEAVFYLGFLWAFYDPLKQSWHDKFGRTVVINAN